MANTRTNQCAAALALSIFLGASRAAAHTIDIIELPNGGGTRAVIDGLIINTFPGAETISVGANLNDGLYTPQVLNVNIYDDVAHMMVSDELTITVPAQNPGQITVGLTSLSPGATLQALSPEDIGLTEIAGLQNIVTLTNSSRIQTTIRFQSDDAPAVVPEPATLALSLAGLTWMLVSARKRFWKRNDSNATPLSIRSS